MKKYLVVASTGFEIAPFIDFLDQNAQKENFFSYIYNDHHITPFVAGVGALFLSFGISRYPGIGDMHMLINAGVAGAYNKELVLGEVVRVEADRFGDLGVQEADGSFTDLFEMQLHDPNKYPFSDGNISIEGMSETLDDIKTVKGITVNTVHGTRQSIEQITAKYKADVESMEGAGFMYACNMLRLKGIQIRSISNYVEPRNKENWELSLAIKNLNEYLISYFS